MDGILPFVINAIPAMAVAVAPAIFFGAVLCSAILFWRKRPMVAVLALVPAVLLGGQEAYYWLRDDRQAAQFEKIQIFGTVDRTLPVVLALDQPAGCNHICSHLIISNTLPAVMKTSLEDLRNKNPRAGKYYQIAIKPECRGRLKSINLMEAWTCIESAEIPALPESYIRIAYGTRAYHAVHEAGFPQLEEANYQGSYFLIVDHVERSGQTTRLAQAFKQIVGTDGKNVVGVQESDDQALEKIMGWSIYAGRKN
jgi:hypothetical protein